VSSAPAPAPWSRAHLPRRVRDGALLAGVCAGLARRLRIDPLLLRVAFVATAVAGGAGILLYGLAVLAMPAPDGRPARLEDLRHGPLTGWREATGLGLLVLSLLLALRALGVWFSDAVVWPLVLTATGLALLWRQSGSRRPSVGMRTLLGVALIVGGAVAFLSATDALGGLRDLGVAAAVVFVGTVLVFGPWWLRLSQALTAERAARIRSQERAEVAAHLHDSVLQTLALIQRRAGDEREVAQLARRQERELRDWLNDEPAPDAGTLAAALRAAGADVEAAHGVPVEVVAVGDCPLDERLGAVVAAAREAMANAARFSGAARVDVFAETGEQQVEVFVRDRGAGFDRAAVPPDRRGVRESIEGRMERHGGRAAVVTAPGAGTEVELAMERR
jgi:signal transduction histidine kinase/phage shock protein PspC (stress-responsive transcriptional regulator)